MKLQGLELDIEGARDDIPLISQSLGQQLGSLLHPVASIVDGELVDDPGAPAGQIQPQIAAPRKAKRRKSVFSTTDASEKAASTVNFKHDSSKYGMPRQQWNPTQKSLWLLYVVKALAGVDELSASAIAKTFNQHFKQAGTIRASNVSRDLGKAKLTAPVPVGENTTTHPSLWFLTDEGARRVQALIAEAMSPSS